ncbi:MAG: SprT-like domain-containing protein [Roseiarcus sp.]|jgi:predicted SprT family Zn-dependent metalloprotease
MFAAPQRTGIAACAPKSVRRPARSHAQLDDAFEFFNRELFGGKLPPCLITFERQGRALGYFAPSRFVNVDDASEVVDEIALNPIHFARRLTPEVLSTLMHEMAHLWQHHFDRPGRRGYHNRRWALKMIDIGLVPSSTGKPGGRPTGDHVSHSIRENGPFDRACKSYLSTTRTTLFQDRAYRCVEADEGEEIAGSQPRSTDEDHSLRERERKAASKTRYRCPTPGCQVAWANRGSKLICALCDEEMLP